MEAVNRGLARLVAGIVGFLGTIMFLMSGQLLGFLFIFLAPLVAIAIHELGHAIAAWQAGMNVREIAVGPFAFRSRPLRFGWSKETVGYDVGGHVDYDESGGRYLTRASHRMIIAAGPLANFFTFVVAYAISRPLVDIPGMGMLMAFSFTSLAVFVLAAWPHRMESGRLNDAAEFLKTFDFRRATPKRPKRSPWQAP